MSPTNLKAGLLTYLALVSVKLGYPLSIILRSEEPATAADLLNVCKQIAPKKSYREVQQLKYEELYMDREYFEEKVIICQDLSGLKKAMPDFLMLLTQGFATRQENYKSKLGSGIKERMIKYPIGFIGIEPVNRETILNHPSIIRVPVGNTDCFKNMNLCSVVNDRTQNGNTDMRIETRRIATIFERLAYKKVDIPYYQQFFSHVLKQKPSNLLEKFKVIHKLISIISIINNPQPLTTAEMYAKLINVDFKDMKKMSETEIVITATKVEYYLTKLLLDDVIPVKINSLTTSQIRVFEAVKAINFGKLRSTFINQNSVREKLWTVLKSSRFWAKKEEIFEQVNKTSSEIVTFPVIDKELSSIKKMGLVETQRLEKSYKYGYYIVVPEANGSINLPNPSQIIDPLLCNQRVKVKNPLTGEIDIIEDLKILDVTTTKNI